MGTAPNQDDAVIANPNESDARILLMRPKFEMNVAHIVRAAACFGVRHIEIYQPRYVPASGAKGDRKPRPLRMKEYRSVQIETMGAINLPTSYASIAVELVEDAELLWAFEHPDRAVYIFGPEDGNIQSDVLAQCQQVVMIPSRFCLNLAAAVNIVLYDRMQKSIRYAG